jgi:hypothetical protein
MEYRPDGKLREVLQCLGSGGFEQCLIKLRLQGKVEADVKGRLFPAPHVVEKAVGYAYGLEFHIFPHFLTAWKNFL